MKMSSLGLTLPSAYATCKIKEIPAWRSHAWNDQSYPEWGDDTGWVYPHPLPQAGDQRPHSNWNGNLCISAGPDWQWQQAAVSTHEPSEEDVLKEWAKNHQQGLARALFKAAGKVAAALPGITSSIVSWLLNLLAQTAIWLAENLWVMALAVAGIRPGAARDRQGSPSCKPKSKWAYSNSTHYERAFLRFGAHQAG